MEQRQRTTQQLPEYSPGPRFAYVIGYLGLETSGRVVLTDVMLKSQKAEELTVLVSAAHAPVTLVEEKAQTYEEAMVLCMRHVDERARLQGATWKAIALLLRDHVRSYEPSLYRRYERL